MNYIYQEPLNFRKGVGAVLGSFSPLHSGHLDLIYKAKKECLGGVIVIVCGHKFDKGYPRMTLEKRYQMVREFFKSDPLVAVYCLSDDEMGIAGCTDQWEIWLKHFWNDIVLLNANGVANNDPEATNITFYVGENEYAGHIKTFGFRVVLVDRKLNPISGTMIRSNPLKYWDSIAWTYHRVFSHNILITGTASEGKTTLVEDIGRYFNIPFSFEWARSYISDHYIGDWEFDTRDFLSFLNGQYEYNRSCIESRLNKGIFISDTDSIVTKMYAKYYAMDEEMSLTMEDYENVLAPVADVYSKRSHWDKVFVIIPRNEEIADDHTRYMKHGSLQVRNELANILFDELEKAGLSNKLEILNDGYLNNFNKVKNYIEQVEAVKNNA